MIFDGDCGFCRKWIARWQSITGDRVEYAPYQEVGERYPQIPRTDFEAAVQFLEPDGQVFGGAEGVFRALAQVPGRGCGLWFFRHAPLFAPISRAVYRFVAGHRRGLSTMTQWLWGRHLERPTYELSRRLFIRLLGVVYLIAFASLGIQIIGLAGEHGIAPIADYLPRVRQALGTEAYRSFPTLCWYDASDSFLRFLCWGGAGLSGLLVLGIAPVPLLVVLWAFYLSLTLAGGVFMHFQWDILLLETGFLAIFYAPLSWRLASPRAAPQFGIAHWLVKWLLFRLMVLSGVVKLMAHDDAWRQLTALNFHYETQPLPTWAAWYAHQLPEWFQRTSIVLVLVVELAVPFLLFAPRRIRHAACAAIVGFMALIAVTGNYNFFNLLTAALCVALLDDALLARFASRRVRARLEAPKQAVRWRFVRGIPVALLAVFVVPVSLAEAYRGVYHRRIDSAWVAKVLGYVEPFNLVNSYGLFRDMTHRRPEIVMEGSNDGKTWLEYEFKWKPGDLMRRPGFVEPHQPRLDWQMWFAALGRHEHNPWFGALMRRLLEGSPPVVALLEKNPFPDAPPHYVRAILYDYHFTDSKTRGETGAWWHREKLGMYCRPLSLAGH